MSKDNQMLPRKPVLDRFADEGELRDFLADNLHLVERDLVLLGKEHVLDNPDGSGGRIDILACDPFGHVVCIETKRSDNSARSTLNEIGKYIALLVERHQLQHDMIRCVVISTHWKELLLPLSYFANSVGVHMTALEAKRGGDGIILEPVSMIEFKFLPQLSPDMDLICFDTEEPRLRYVEFLKSRAVRLPFVRLALLIFERRAEANDDYLAIR